MRAKATECQQMSNMEAMPSEPLLFTNSSTISIRLLIFSAKVMIILYLGT